MAAGASLVAGVDSSTQSCKVVVGDADSGAFVRSGRAPHPGGTEVDPAAWWDALGVALADAGGLEDVVALSVAGQQHGMVALADDGSVVRPALLWNDTRSAPQAQRLVDELGGPEAWADAVGVVPVASFTITKLAWLAQHEPRNAGRTEAVCLPHDWLSWRLAGFGPHRSQLASLHTDRGDASGTGYFSALLDDYRPDLLELALGRTAILPRVLRPAERGGVMDSDFGSGPMLAPGTGDNAAAALGLGAEPGDVVVSIGTSGVVSAVSRTATRDPTGIVAGFADATGAYLPLVCTLNAARVLSSAAAMLGVDLDELSRLALSAPPGSDGLVLVPYLEGERTPNRPDSAGALHGLTLDTATPAHLARAAVEGVLCGLADGLDAIVREGVVVRRILLVGGGAQSEAVRQIAPTIFGRSVVVPAAGEYVAEGAARQAAWVWSGAAEPPQWPRTGTLTYDGGDDDIAAQVRGRYAQACDLTVERQRMR